MLGSALPQRKSISSTIRSANDPPSSAEGGKENFASAEARRWLSDRPRHPFGSLTYKLVSYQRRQVAAALSAAVTTTKPIGEAPNSQAEPTMQKQPRQTPAALREGARGRGVSQRSRLPRIPHTVPSSRGGAGESASPWRSTLPREPSALLHFMRGWRRRIFLWLPFEFCPWRR